MPRPASAAHDRGRGRCPKRIHAARSTGPKSYAFRRHKKGAPVQAPHAPALFWRPVASQIRRHARRLGCLFVALSLLPTRCLSSAFRYSFAPCLLFRSGNFWGFLDTPTRARGRVTKSHTRPGVFTKVDISEGAPCWYMLVFLRACPGAPTFADFWGVATRARVRLGE